MNAGSLLIPNEAHDLEHVAPVVLFLDFDGGLHAVGEPALDEDWRLVANPNLFGWRHILEDALTLHPAVRIVVSSDWRRLFDDENLARLLGPVLGPRVLGAVEVVRTSRAEEILVEAARRRVSYWLAVDDHPSVAIARRAGDARFIVCNPDSGLNNPRVRNELTRKLADLVRRHQVEQAGRQAL